jgi:hypothetical protein
MECRLKNGPANRKRLRGMAQEKRGRTGVAKMADKFKTSAGAMALSFALALFSLTACQHAPSKVAAGPPPPFPAPAVAPASAQPSVAPAPAAAEPAKAEEPAIVTPPTIAPPVPAPETKDVPPVPDKTTASKPVTHAPPKPPAPNPAAPPKTDPPAPAPARIEATLPPAEQTAYRKRAERAILETQQNLDAIRDARLNRDDQSTLRQAVTFLRDAQKAMKAGDLVGAATLAEKSRLLSQELRKRYAS